MRRLTLTGNCDIADPDGIAAGVTGATFTLVTTAIATDSLAHKLTILNNTANDHSGKILTIVGTAFGKTVTETLNGPTGSQTVTTTKFYDVITSITPDATIGVDTFDLGWEVDAVTDWFQVGLDRLHNIQSIVFGCAVASGVPSYGVEHHFGDESKTAFPHPIVAGKTTNEQGEYTHYVEGIRLIWTIAGPVTLAGSWVTKF